MCDSAAAIVNRSDPGVWSRQEYALADKRREEVEARYDVTPTQEYAVTRTSNNCVPGRPWPYAAAIRWPDRVGGRRRPRAGKVSR